MSDQLGEGEWCVIDPQVNEGCCSRMLERSRYYCSPPELRAAYSPPPSGHVEGCVATRDTPYARRMEKLRLLPIFGSRP